MKSHEASPRSIGRKAGVNPNTISVEAKKCIHCGTPLSDDIVSNWGRQCPDCENSPLVNSLQDMTEKIHLLATEKGWWDKPRETGTIIALIHSELSEALEADRNNLPSEKIPPFTGIEEEMSDVIIRILDAAGYYGWRIGEAIEAKHLYNRQRSYRHGDKKY